jgi:hypothetical protein
MVRVAVFQILPGGLDLDEHKLAALSFHLGGKVSDAGVEVIPWNEIYTFLRKQDQYLCLDRHCQMEVERHFGADYGLAVQILPLGSSCSLSATLYLALQPASLRTALVKGACDEDALVRSLEALVGGLVAQGGFPATRSRPVLAAAARARPEGGDGREPGEDAGERGHPDHRVILGPVYAPAPLLLQDPGAFGADKTRDQAGPVLAYEHRLGGSFFVGGQAELLFGEGLMLFAPGFRLGFAFEILERLSLLVRLMAGMTYLERSDVDHLGFRVGLATGARWMFHRQLGLQLEIGGANDTVFRLGDAPGRNALSFFKLEIALGLVIAF